MSFAPNETSNRIYVGTRSSWSFGLENIVGSTNTQIGAGAAAEKVITGYLCPTASSGTYRLLDSVGGT